MWWIYMDDYESSLDSQTLDVKRLEIEKCAYKNCGFTFLDIHSYYWQFHPEYIKPNMRVTNHTKDTVTGLQNFNIDQLRSNREEKTESVDKTKPKEKQELIAVVAVGAQPAKDKSYNAPDIKTGSKLAPALEINMGSSTNEKTDQVEGKEEKNKDDGERKTRSNSLSKTESANDALEDENPKKVLKSLQNLNQLRIRRLKKVEKVSSTPSMD